MNHTSELQPSSSRPRRHATSVAAIVGVATIVAAGCTLQQSEPPGPTMPKVHLVSALTKFDRCDDFLAYVKEAATKRVGAYGLGGIGAYGGPGVAIDGRVPMEDFDARREATAMDTTAAASAPAAPATTSGFSSEQKSADTGTNNQEKGVDEADIVKTDGHRVVTIHGDDLVVTQLIDGAPYLTDRVALTGDTGNARLFLSGDRAYVLADHELVEVDLAGTPHVTHRSTVDGRILDGRMANGVLRIVVDSAEPAHLGFISPNSPDAEAFAVEQNKKIIADSTIEDWVPTVRTDRGAAAPLIDCDELYRPAEFSGFSVLSVLTITDGLESMTSTGVQADGGITYASTDHLYVATSAWRSDAPNPNEDRSVGGREHTDVHSFSIAGTAPASYQASGRVEGHVLNQYSMSEYHQNLRIATTVRAGGGEVPSCPPDAVCSMPARGAAAGDSRVTVLGAKGPELVELGMVDGLGVGEQIRSVRYVDDIAYVVTFRQTDPFYVIDLSDPAHPAKLGELKVPGFSAYLHPVGDHLVLGVGVDASGRGIVSGGKLSLYDTSDPLHPREVTTFVRDDLSFGVADDSHAFHWDPTRHLAFVPYMSSPVATATDVCCVRMPYQAPLGGVIALKVDESGITEKGRIVHLDRTASPDRATPSTTAPTTTAPTTTAPATTPTTTPATTPVDPGNLAQMVPMISRVFVVGDRVITLSEAGIGANDITTFRLAGFAAF